MEALRGAQQVQNRQSLAACTQTHVLFSCAARNVPSQRCAQGLQPVCAQGMQAKYHFVEKESKVVAQGCEGTEQGAALADGAMSARRTILMPQAVFVRKSVPSVLSASSTTSAGTCHAWGAGH